MKFNIRLLPLLIALLFSAAPAVAQQVKETGTEQTIPLKTVIIKDPGSEQPAAFLSGVEILRFWVYKAGTTSDVTKIMRSLTSAEGVKKITEGTVNGDFKEFVLELNGPRPLTWYKETFLSAGLRNIKFNSAPVRPIKDL